MNVGTPFGFFQIKVLPYRGPCSMSTSRYMVSDCVITDGSRIEATVSSSHIIDQVVVPEGGLDSRYTCFTCLASGPPASTTRRINRSLDHTFAPTSNGVMTISFHGSRITIAAASGSHHQLNEGLPALLPPMM